MGSSFIAGGKRLCEFSDLVFKRRSVAIVMNMIKATRAAKTDEIWIGFYITDKLIHLFTGEVDDCRIAVIHALFRSDLTRTISGLFAILRICLS